MTVRTMYYANVLCLLAHALAVESRSRKTVLCIQEFQSSECSDYECDWYGNLTFNLSQYIKNNTEIKFCESQVTLFDLIHITNKTNLLLHGISYHTLTTVQCEQDFVRNVNGSGFRFTNIIQLQIMNILFIGCGAIHDGSTIFYDKTIQFLASIYIYYSINVQIKYVRIEDGNGTGLAIIDTTGYVEVAYSSFKNNSIKGDTTLSGGRGVYVDFTYCPPGTVTGCENVKRNNKNSVYVFTHNIFMLNTASHAIQWYHTPFQYRSQKRVFKEVGFGGGLIIYIRADASGHNITIDKCKFLDNKAILGGGLLVSFHDTPNNNSVIVRNSAFDQNVAKKGGGGIDVGFLIFTDHPTSLPASRNFVTFGHCNMTRNSAEYGGGTKVFSTRSFYNSFNNRISFSKCQWEQNIDLAQLSKYLHIHGILL